MRHVQGRSGVEAEAGQEKASALLLVRCWLEPNGTAEPVLRGYIRDLHGGGEVPIADLKAVEAQLRRQLGLDQPATKQLKNELSA
jgi:hypothetical protein